VYVAKHGCGFTTWPSQARIPNGKVYPYSIANSPAAGRDIVAEFVNSTRSAGVKPGFYYSVVSNAYLRVTSGSVDPNSGVGPNQINVTQAEYEAIVLQQVTELWTQHGALGRLGSILHFLQCLSLFAIQRGDLV
jgi:alpha-L-fucosidase